MDTTRTLLLLRHAKSSWDDPDLDDFDRPLNPRGRRDAPRMGRWIQQAGYRPELGLVSGAARTRQTWKGVAEELATEPEVRFEDQLYHATPERIIEQIRQLPPDVTTALLIGHNPGFERTMNRLAPGGESKERRRMSSKVPTASLAVLKWTGDWEMAGKGIAELERFVRPKDLED